MNNLQIFKSTDFGSIRTLIENGFILFCGSDIAKALKYSNAPDALSRHCKGIVKRYTLTNGGKQELLFIPRSDLYRLITHSKLPAAEKFEKWIFEEVIPAIHDHGGYLTDKKIEEIIDDPDTLIKLATKLKAERAEKARLVERIKQDRPKVLFAESVSVSDDTISMGAMAKILNQNGVEIGRNRLFAWLNENKYLMTEGGKKNIPTQTSMEKGLFEVLESEVFRPSGESILTLTTKVTGKGQAYFINKFIKAEKIKIKES